MEPKQHVIAWFEIPVDDLDRAKTFYENILQITMHPMEFPSGLKMAMFPGEEGMVGGALCHHPEFYRPATDGSLVYLNGNPDLQNILDRIPKAGGEILVPKTQITPEYGYMAVFRDTEGNRVALHSIP
jgi:uncharacterized protein